MWQIFDPLLKVWNVYAIVCSHMCAIRPLFLVSCNMFNVHFQTRLFLSRHGHQHIGQLRNFYNHLSDYWWSSTTGMGRGSSRARSKIASWVCCDYIDIKDCISGSFRWNFVFHFVEIERMERPVRCSTMDVIL